MRALWPLLALAGMLHAQAADAPQTPDLSTPTAEARRFTRGLGPYPTYHAFVIPVDLQKGVQLRPLVSYAAEPPQADAAYFGKFAGGRPWFFRLSRPTLRQVALIGATDSNGQPQGGQLVYPVGDGGLEFNTPVAAFGSSAGGDPLYEKRPYRFAVHAGLLQQNIFGDKSALSIVVVKRGTTNGIDTSFNGGTGLQEFTIPLPMPVDNVTGKVDTSSKWEEFGDGGFRLIHQTQISVGGINKTVLETTIQYIDSGRNNELGVSYDAPLLVTHTCLDKDYMFEVRYRGFAARHEAGVLKQILPFNVKPTADASTVEIADHYMYTMDFEAEPAWRTRLLSTPHFTRTPSPSTYIGKTVEEIEKTLPLVEFGATVTHPSVGEAADSALGTSPELRVHPVLDDLVKTVGNKPTSAPASDPLALVNYVHNYIGLVDALSWNENSQFKEMSVNAGGLSRGALATYMEGQGNPWEQCALLVYLLKRAGYQAEYVKASHTAPGSTTVLNPQAPQIMAKRLSQLLRMQIVGVQNSDGTLIQETDMIPVNYPWVTAYLPSDPTNAASDKKWVHFFPWFKDTEIVEGQNLFEYLNPADAGDNDHNKYNSGYLWVEKYINKDPEIFFDGSGSDENDTPLNLFPKFITRKLNAWRPGFSIDHMGVRYRDRINNRSQWTDFPRPYFKPDANSNVATLPPNSLTLKTKLRINSADDSLFDRVKLTLVSSDNPNNKFVTANMRITDLHNRRITGYFSREGGSSTFNFGMEPFAPGTTGTQGWNDIDDPIAKTQLTTLTGLQRTTNVEVTVTLQRHNALAETHPDLPTSWNSFLGVSNALTHSQLITFRAGDHASLCMNLGRVSQRMVNTHLAAFNEEAQSLKNKGASATFHDRARYLGAITQLMGYSYYRDLNNYTTQLEALLKVNTLSKNMFGLAKLGGKWVNDNYEPAYPIVDMVVIDLASAGSGQLRPDTGGRDILTKGQDFSRLFIAGASALEHQTIKDFFPEETMDAVSTVNLLHRSHDSNASDATKSSFIRLNRTNYINQGETLQTVNGTTKKLKDWDPGLWRSVTTAFEGENGTPGTLSADGQETVAWITPGPVTGAKGAFSGMGVLILSPNSAGALIGSLSGGMGGMLSIKVGDPNLGIITYTGSIFADHDNGVAYGKYDTISYAKVPTPSAPIISSVFSSGSAAYTFFEQTSYGGSANFGSSSSASMYLPPPQVAMFNSIRVDSFSGLTITSSLSSAVALTINKGYLGSEYHVTAGTSPMGMDPVDFVTGAFYIDEVDLRLPGPLPMEVRRNYSSHNLGDGGLGFGWQVAYFPYLVIGADSGEVIRAAELDGSVITYRKTRNLDHSQKQHADTLDLDGDADTSEMVSEWYVSALDNPSMTNGNGLEMGSIRNPFHNRMDRVSSTVAGKTVNTYVIFAADGSKRFYKDDEFPIQGAAPAVGDPETINRARPYIYQWQDHAGNSLSFNYGRDPGPSLIRRPDYGQVTRIDASNGNSLSFEYDPNGHVISVAAGDGRRVSYAYDMYGDLVEVTRPDNSWIKYTYSHLNAPPATGKPSVWYSTHLVETVNTSGRVLKNAYDSDRRVTHQWSNIGRHAGQAVESLDPATAFDPSVPAEESYDLILQGKVTYANTKDENAFLLDGNGNPTTTPNPNYLTYTGTTTIADPYGRETRYIYNKSRIKFIRRVDVHDPKNPVPAGQRQDLISSYQEWYELNADGSFTPVPGGFPRALSKSSAPFYISTSVADAAVAPPSDASVLKNAFYYNDQGDLTRGESIGDLVGNGASATATTTASYHPVTHLPLQVVDPIGRATSFTYAAPNTSFMGGLGMGAAVSYLVETIEQSVPQGGGAFTPILRTTNHYTKQVSGPTASYGLLEQVTTEDLSVGGGDVQKITAFEYTSYGFPSKQIEWVDAHGSDPRGAGQGSNGVIHGFAYNLRGELVEKVDPSGHKILYAYDDMGRRIWEERHQKNSTGSGFSQVGWNYQYYNLTGEPEWTDGSRSNPEDYTYTRYDGAGRPVEKVAWLSQAKADGSGVEAVPGAGMYASIVNRYNLFGDLVMVSDPRGNETWSRYDTIGRKVAQASFEGSPGASVDWAGVFGASPAASVLARQSFTYDAAGRVTSATDALGRVTSTAYTANGKTKSVITPLGITLETRYDLLGRVVREPVDSATFWKITYNDLTRTVTRELRAISTDVANGAALPAALQILEITQMDCRGNVTSKAVKNGASGTEIRTETVYDGLDRPVLVSGPPGSGTIGSGSSQTQRTAYRYYPAQDVTETHAGVNVSGASPTVVTRTELDALGRQTKVSTHTLSGGNLSDALRITSYIYDPHHHYVVQTTGQGAYTEAGSSGSFGISTTTYTNTLGKAVLVVKADGSKQRVVYDVAGNAVASVDELGQITRTEYDGLNRPLVVYAPDEGGDVVPTAFTYDLLGQPLTREMGKGAAKITEVSEYFASSNNGGAAWKTGLLRQKYIQQGTSKTRLYDYSASDVYDSTHHGLLRHFTDPQGIVHALDYDARLRPFRHTTTAGTNTIADGSPPRSRGLFRYAVFDFRGQVSEVFERTAEGASQVSRTYDGYGQLLTEEVRLAEGLNEGSDSTAPSLTGSMQTTAHFINDYNALGRRVTLKTGANLAAVGTSGTAFQQTFDHTPDGLLQGIQVNGQSFASYQYLNNGIQHLREIHGHQITQTARRDAMGRSLEITHSLPDNTSFFVEKVAYTTDGRQSSYSTTVNSTILPEAGNEARSYAYNARRKLVSESSIPSAAPAQTLSHQYDFGTTGGLGVLTATSAGGADLAAVSSGGISFGRVTAEGSLRQPSPTIIKGEAKGAKEVELSYAGKVSLVNLDFPADIDGDSTNNFREGAWRSLAHLPPGTHMLHGLARHPSGLFEASSDRRFRIDVPESALTVTVTYDNAGSSSEGNVIRRLFRFGTKVARDQCLAWDEAGRLVAVVDSFYNTVSPGNELVSTNTWQARYDALGRRVRCSTGATYTFGLGTSGEFTPLSLEETSLYDPLHEFLEIAVEQTRFTSNKTIVSHSRTWKLHGTDLNGKYGVLDGIGGFQATLEETTGVVEGLVTDLYGHTVAYAKKSATTVTLTASTIRCTGYGPAPGAYSASLYECGSVAHATTWRGRRMEVTGFYHLGARYYEPNSGRFLSPDPMGHGASMSLYDYAGGDPINFVDPRGRRAGRSDESGVTASIDPYIADSRQRLAAFASSVNALVAKNEAFAARNREVANNVDPRDVSADIAKQKWYPVGVSYGERETYDQVELAKEILTEVAILVATDGLGRVLSSAKYASSVSRFTSTTAGRSVAANTFRGTLAWEVEAAEAAAARSLNRPVLNLVDVEGTLVWEGEVTATSKLALPGPASRLALPAPKGTNPYPAGIPLNAGPAPEGTIINMAMSPGQPINRPGGFGTLSVIPDVNYVRNTLAVIPEFKQEIGYVQSYLIRAGTQIQWGPVGPQTDSNGIFYPGGGDQVQILVPPQDRSSVLIPVGPQQPIK